MRVVLHVDLLLEQALLLCLYSVEVLEYLLGLAVVADVHDEVDLLLLLQIFAKVTAFLLDEALDEFFLK